MNPKREIMRSRCPECGSNVAWRDSDNTLVCGSCARDLPPSHADDLHRALVAALTPAGRIGGGE